MGPLSPLHPEPTETAGPELSLVANEPTPNFDLEMIWLPAGDLEPAAPLDRSEPAVATTPEGPQPSSGGAAPASSAGPASEDAASATEPTSTEPRPRVRLVGTTPTTPETPTGTRIRVIGPPSGRPLQRVIRITRHNDTP
jgi:hypothetical protein